MGKRFQLQANSNLIVLSWEEILAFKTQIEKKSGSISNVIHGHTTGEWGHMHRY